MRATFTDEQKIKAVQDLASGRAKNDICEELGIQPGQLMQWKERYGGHNGYSNGDDSQLIINDLKERNAKLIEENALWQKMYLEKSMEVYRLGERLKEYQAQETLQKKR
jgi:transposase-like protein